MAEQDRDWVRNVTAKEIVESGNQGQCAESFRGLTFSKQSVGGSMSKCHTNKLYGNLFAGQMWVGQDPLFGEKVKK